MNRFLHYLFGLGLIVFSGFLFVWFYGDLLYLIIHITNPVSFARIFSPIIAVYLGLFYLYSAIKNKITFESNASLYVLMIGLIASIIIMFFTPMVFGGPRPHYVVILDATWRILFPLSIFISTIFSFISFFKKK